MGQQRQVLKKEGLLFPAPTPLLRHRLPTPTAVHPPRSRGLPLSLQATGSQGRGADIVTGKAPEGEGRARGQLSRCVCRDTAQFSWAGTVWVAPF